MVTRLFSADKSKANMNSRSTCEKSPNYYVVYR